MHAKMGGKAVATKSVESDGYITELNMDDTVFDLKRRDEPKILSSKYLLGKVIGRGVSAEVIEILDLDSLQRKVVKVFKVPRKFSLGQTSESKLREISDEYRILKRLSHKNVIKAFEMVRQQDEWQVTLAVVTEYCSGSLEELRLSRPDNRLPLQNCHFYFHQLLDGVEYLHSKSIVHGDVKPANLMLVNDNTLKLADFGSYLDLGIFPGKIKKGISGASPYFQPPEQLSPPNEEPDRRTKCRMYFSSDVWSCGIVLFMIACGRHPFLLTEEASEDDLYRAIVGKPFFVTPVIAKNRALDLLFGKIFELDFHKRAGITSIKRDAWYNISVSHSDTAGISARTSYDGRIGDKYRSMTMTQALNQLVRPISSTVKVLGKDLHDFETRKEIPYVRGNRSPEPPRSPPQSLFKSIKHRASSLRRKF